MGRLDRVWALAALRWAAAPAAFAAAWLLAAGLPGPQRAVAAVFAFAVAGWVAEAQPLPVTALVSAALLVVVAGRDEKTVFAAFGDPVIPLFVGSFLLARAIEATRLGERVAWGVLAWRAVGRSPSRAVLALGAVACGVSLVASNTATTAMLLPIGLGIAGALGRAERGSPLAVATLLMLTWGSSVAVGVPVGTPPNLIGLAAIEESTGIRISFAQWAAFGLPITAVMLGACWLVLRRLYRLPGAATGETSDGPSAAVPGAAYDAPPRAVRGDPAAGARPSALDPALAARRLSDLGPLTLAERSTLAAFVVALAAWLAPDVAAAVLGRGHPAAEWLLARLPLSVGAIGAAAALFVLPAERRPYRAVLQWTDAAHIDWGTILLFGGGIALGRAMDESGLAATIGGVAAGTFGADSLWTITALVTTAAVILSEIASNTASASILAPVAIGLAEAAGVSPIAPVLGVALGASLGFMMPVSTPPNAIVYGSGLVPQREMMRAGLVIDLIGLVVTLVGLRLILPLLGLA